MTIIQLGTFLKIAETRSFTSAAALLGYAQSTVTTQIKQLEEELGCLLFDRLGKNVILTAEGEKLKSLPACSGWEFRNPFATTGCRRR